MFWNHERWTIIQGVDSPIGLSLGAAIAPISPATLTSLDCIALSQLLHYHSAVLNGKSPFKLLTLRLQAQTRCVNLWSARHTPRELLASWWTPYRHYPPSPRRNSVRPIRRHHTS